MVNKLRRRSKRYDLPSPLAPLLRWRGKTGEHDGCISEISLTGCFLNTRGKADIGEVISFKTGLASGQVVDLHGEAVHHDKKLTGFGLRFIYRSPEERVFVALLIAEADNRSEVRRAN